MIFGWPVVFCADKPNLSHFDFVVLVVANYGDEELQPDMEAYLLDCEAYIIRFALCELGNYFGFEDDCFGCKKEILRLARERNWECVSHVSVDSYPELDETKLRRWALEVREIAGDNHTI